MTLRGSAECPVHSSEAVRQRDTERRFGTVAMEHHAPNSGGLGSIPADVPDIPDELPDLPESESELWSSRALLIVRRSLPGVKP